MSNAKKKILIIEDDRALSKLYEKHLRSQGYEIAVAFDGEEGLRRVKEFKPNLILLDIVMPKLDGISVLKILKKDSATNKIPVIMLTVLEKTESISEALQAGITHYLIKSNYSLDELGHKVEEILEQKPTLGVSQPLFRPRRIRLWRKWGGNLAKANRKPD